MLRGKEKDPSGMLGKSIGERLREAFTELGPTFIKFGQILCDRKDILPYHIIKELEKLQDNVPPFPSEEAVSIIEETLGSPVSSLFLRFDREPDAAASLAQVHRAMLPTGKPVAVKIKRPGIDEQIEADITVMRQIASFLDKRTSFFEVITAEEVVSEFETQIRKELDFVEEFFSLVKFRELYKDNKNIVVPFVYDQYTRRNILVMDYIHGKKVSEVINEKDPKFDLKLINRRNADFLMSQLFINGFFHADPHPGNFLVLEGNKICYVDFGMVYSLRPYEIENLNYMMIGLARLDPSLVGRSILKMGRAEGKVNKDQFQAVVHDFIESYLDKPMAYIDVAMALITLLQIVMRFGIHIPPRFIYVAKVLGTLQSISAGLDPDFNIIEYLKDYSPHIWAHQLGGRETGNKVLISGLNWSELALQAPEIFFDLRRALQERDFIIHTPEVDTMRETLDQVGFRLVSGLVLSALLISSSLIVLADIRPQIYGIPIFGIIGYATGAVMGMAFLFMGIKKLFSWHHKK
jgi:ubiquinone biosynthesis protein